MLGSWSEVVTGLLVGAETGVALGSWSEASTGIGLEFCCAVEAEAMTGVGTVVSSGNGFGVELVLEAEVL